MALYKEIEETSGIITKYHRIVSVNVVTNIQNIIEIASYTSQEKREEEIDAIKNRTECNVYIKTTYRSTNYNKDMTVDTAYEWLKTLPEFSGSEDV